MRFQSGSEIERRFYDAGAAIESEFESHVAANVCVGRPPNGFVEIKPMESCAARHERRAVRFPIYLTHDRNEAPALKKADCLAGDIDTGIDTQFVDSRGEREGFHF